MGEKSGLLDRSSDIIWMVSAKWATLGKQDWRCGMNQTLG